MEQKSGRRTTVLDVARAAGVSAMTVSRVLSPDTAKFHVAPSTREKVMQAARTLNYRPNAGARSIRNRRFQAIGYMQMCDPDHASFGDLTAYAVGIGDAAADNDCVITLMRPPSRRARAAGEIPKALRELSLDGIIIHDIHLASPDLIKAVRSCELPTVTINHKAATNSVFVDEHSAAVTVTQHLILEGRRKIVFVTAPESLSNFASEDRIEGYHQAMTSAGLEPRTIPFPPLSDPNSSMDLTQWLEFIDQPEALVCDGDNLAAGLLPHLLRARVDVPGELALAGFEGNAVGLRFPVDYVTATHPVYEMGYAAVTMLLSLFKLDAVGGAICPSVLFQADLYVNGKPARVRSGDLDNASEPDGAAASWEL